jgi:hypothetical protein
MNIQEALEIARTTDGELDPAIATILNDAVRNIWGKVLAQPTSYILAKDEFAVFNYHLDRLPDQNVAKAAVKRFWDNYNHLGNKSGNAARRS